MAEHAQFVAHLLDPSEVKLVQQANRFAERFLDSPERPSGSSQEGGLTATCES